MAGLPLSQLHIIGVPHINLNTFVQKLICYERRSKDQPGLIAPELPEDIQPEASKTKKSREKKYWQDWKEALDSGLTYQHPDGNEADESPDAALITGTDSSFSTTLPTGSDHTSSRRFSSSSNYSSYSPDLPIITSIKRSLTTRTTASVCADKPYSELWPSPALNHFSQSYQNLVLNTLGIPTPDLPPEHPLKAERYGWRLVESENVLNMSLCQGFWAEVEARDGKVGYSAHKPLGPGGKFNAERMENRVVYFGGEVHQIDEIVCKGFPAVAAIKGGREKDPVEFTVSPNPNTALAHSPWYCPLSADHPSAKQDPRKGQANPKEPITPALLCSPLLSPDFHSPRTCTHPHKTKITLVCGYLPPRSGSAFSSIKTSGEDRAIGVRDPKQLLPLRVETYEWKAATKSQVQAYADFAKECCMGLKIEHEEVDPGDANTL